MGKRQSEWANDKRWVCPHLVQLDGSLQRLDAIGNLLISVVIGREIHLLWLDPSAAVQGEAPAAVHTVGRLMGCTAHGQEAGLAWSVGCVSILAAVKGSTNRHCRLDRQHQSA